MVSNSENTGLASSMTDLMTSLAVIFILLLVASYNDGQEEFDEKNRGLTAKEDELERTKDRLRVAEEELQKAKERTDVTRSQILLALQKALENFTAQGVRAETDPRDPLGLLVIVPERLLKFAKNEDQIPEGGVSFLRSFIPVLARTVCSESFEKEISAIVIEGHTDSSGSPTINLPLSQRRSMTVVQKSLNVLSETIADTGNPFMLLECYLRFLSASGRGSSEPVKADGKEDMSRSRRVEFKIRVRSLEQRQQVLGTLGLDTSPQVVESR